MDINSYENIKKRWEQDYDKIKEKWENENSHDYCTEALYWFSKWGYNNEQDFYCENYCCDEIHENSENFDHNKFVFAIDDINTLIDYIEYLREQIEIKNV